MSDGSGANNPAPSDGSGANNPALSDEQRHETHEPHIEVLKGNPTDEELAALLAVLGSAAGGGGEPGQPEQTRWGLPVDKLRYPVFSWQKITLLERVHMRR